VKLLLPRQPRQLLQQQEKQQGVDVAVWLVTATAVPMSAFEHAVGTFELNRKGLLAALKTKVGKGRQQVR
jgi:hypothetical protein